MDDMPESTYGSNVRLGNWYEAICLEEDEIQEFLKLRSQNQLIVQKTRLLLSNFYKEVELDAPSVYIHFGAVVQLNAAEMRICKSKFSNDTKPALSIVINDKMIQKSQKISDKCELTVAPSIKPCSRNSFVIVSGDFFDRTSEVLKYGQDFRIKCVDAEEQPLYIFSTQKSADLGSMISSTYECYDKGQINLPLGLCLGRSTGPGKPIPTAYTRWKCLHVNPSLRFESEGQPVPSNTPLIIAHTATNQYLAAENLEISTLFGQECLASVHTYLDSHKKEQWQNIWMITIGNQIKFH